MKSTPACVALSAFLVASAPLASVANDDTLWIGAERILVRPGEEVTGAVLVQNGVIVAVGEGVEPPEGALEVRGAVVCAGFIDAWSTLGVLREAVADDRTSAATRVTDALAGDGADRYRLESLRAGVTSLRVQVGAEADVGGTSALVSNAIGPVGEELVLLGDACVVATIGVTRRDRPADLFRRVDEVEKLVSSIEAAQGYAHSKADYATKLAEWEEEIAEKEEELEKDFKKAKKKRDEDLEEAEEEGKKFREKRYKEDRRPRKPSFDADKEVLARVASGELPLVVEIHRAAELRELLHHTKRLDGLRLVLAGATEAGGFADELAERDIPVIVWPAPLGAQRTAELAHHDLELAAVLHDAGVEVLFGSGGRPRAHDLPLLAAMAVGHGLDRVAALEALTLGPARRFDVADRVGSVERGKRADLLVLSGDPLDVATEVRFVIQDGEVVVER